MPTESTHGVQQEIDQAIERVVALCELLHAAQQNKVSASSIHSILWPIAHQLDQAAGVMADQQPRK